MKTQRHLSEFKAALFDVDGTLTNLEREISPRTLAALRALQAQGIMTNLATGRTAAGLQEKILPLFPEKSLHITAGGAQIIQPDGKILWEELLSPDIVKSIWRDAEKFDLPINLQQNGLMYVNEGMKEYLSINAKRYFTQHTPHFRDISELKNWSVANIVLFCNDEYLSILKMNPNIQVKQFIDNLTHIAITAPGITKGTAAVRWSELTGIPLSKTMVFGDSDNDIEIFQEAGWSVALGNAIEPLKAIANRVIAHTDQDGLAIYLERIVKGEAL